MHKSTARWIAILPLVMILTATTAEAQARRGAAARAKEKEPDAVLFLAPLGDKVKIEAGTLEVRFAIDYSFSDYLRPLASHCIPFQFIHILNKDADPHEGKENEPWFTAQLYQKRGGNAINLATPFYYRQSKTEPIVRSHGVGVAGSEEAGTWLKRGEWHTFAGTWQVDSNDVLQLEVFLDGKSHQRRAFPIKDSKVPAFGKDDLMGIGGLSLSPASVAAYRLSNRVRTKEEIAANKPLAPDETTTFFLDATTAAKYKIMTRRAFLDARERGKVNAKDGLFVGPMKIVSTPQGKVIQFYEKLSR